MADEKPLPSDGRQRHMPMKPRLLLTVLLFLSSLSSAQQIRVPAGMRSETGLPAAMSELAKQVAETYRDSDRDKYLAALSQLQLAEGNYQDALTSLRSLRELRRSGTNPPSAARLIPYEVYATAKSKEPGIRFDDAFKQSFREYFEKLDAKDSAQAEPWFLSDLQRAKDDLARALQQQRAKDTIPVADAIDLIKKYEFYEIFRSTLPLTPGLFSEDHSRRYVVTEGILVKTPDGASVEALVVLPKSATRVPALLDFTIYVDRDFNLRDAILSAAHGYAGVVAYTRGKGRSADVPVPYEHDGEDATAVIGWISKQPWSDGRVGMYGGSYNGFAAWAAAKHAPPALKALMTSVAAAPGIDVPMEGNVFLNFLYPWPLYTTTNKTLDEARYNDNAHWDALYKKWYTSGAAYRDLEQLDGAPNPIFRRWLEHPAYDVYWQRIIPYRGDFAKIKIPVLQTDGYLEGQGLSSAYYFSEHHKYAPQAEDYYVIGPWNHFGSQRHPATVIDGYTIDPVARIDIEQLRFDWFDYIFKGAPKPSLLKDKVNYEVMGANEWKHAPSIAAMSNESLKFFLAGPVAGDRHALQQTQPAAASAVTQRVAFGDRSDVDWKAPSDIITKTLDTHSAIAFVSDPIPGTIEFSGKFSGRLDFVTNKRDFDFTVTLYELTPSGEYFQLSYCLQRASYAHDRTARRLLTPGKMEHLELTGAHVLSKRFEAGSRLVVLLGIPKESDIQINYGSGKDVSAETIADAKIPVEVKWYNSSRVILPIRK
jgi:putative CocE/NonD family hydrolase